MLENKQTWKQLGEFAPHTRATMEVAGQRLREFSMDVPPLLGATFPGDHGDSYIEWLAMGSDLDDSLTNRELLLRYLLSRAVADQGADIQGVEIWHWRFTEACYSADPPIPIYHRPAALVERYPEVLEFAHIARRAAIEARAEAWAAESARRTTGGYSPFSLGRLGGNQTHWFITGRIYPTLILPLAFQGGLTELIFERGPARERPLEMARRLRDDREHRTGLGYVLGDKASDLFAKWVVGVFLLTPPNTKPWLAADTAIPMDQRIGRVMMRCGIMDEFFGVARLMQRNDEMFEFRGRGDAPTDVLSAAPYYLTVMTFRRNARVPKGSAAETWLDGFWRSHRRTAPPLWTPQAVIGVLCEAVSEAFGILVTPVHLDDFFMDVATPCRDSDPDCPACPLADVCQANTALPALKQYFT